MTERRGPSGFGRGMAVLAIVALGAMAVTPAFSAFNATKGKIKKIARKQATTQINKRVPGLIDAGINDRVPGLIDAGINDQVPGLIGEAIAPFSAALDADDETVVLATNGPLQLKAKCDTTGSDDVRVYFDSTAADWWFSNDQTGDGPNAANLDDDSVGFGLSSVTGVTQYVNDTGDGSAAVRVGNTIHYLATDGEMLGLGTNVFGHKCIAIGKAISHNAPA